MTHTSPPSRSRTETQQGETQQTVDRMPHERDESADSQARAQGGAQAIGQQAHDDLARGLADTSRSAETDAAYHHLRENPTRQGADDAPAAGETRGSPGLRP